jgi:hypothetical protein
MKGFKYKNKLWRWVYVKTVKLFKSDERSRYPKKVTDKEKTVADIFINVLHDPDTKLYYDIKTHECSLKSEKQSLWIFLERENMKVINSTFGYDRTISPELEYYLSDRFRQENNKRRTLMKEEALSKVEHSLSYTLNKIKK